MLGIADEWSYDIHPLDLLLFKDQILFSDLTPPKFTLDIHVIRRASGLTSNLPMATLVLMRSSNEHKDSMDLSNDRELKLLSEVDEIANFTQRQLSQRVGISLGLTNTLFRNLVKKGYIRGTQASWKRWVYALTPEGFARKIGLTVDYIRRELGYYQHVRQTLRTEMESLAFHEETRVAIYGTSDFAELVYIGLKDFGITEIDIFSSESPNGRTFFGMPVRGLDTLDTNEYDRIIVASLGDTDAIATDLESRGKSSNKLVFFFSDSVAKRQA